MSHLEPYLFATGLSASTPTTVFHIDAIISACALRILSVFIFWLNIVKINLGLLIDGNYISGYK